MAKVNFTSGRISAFTCPAGKPQTFLWDLTAPGLGLRVTKAGSRAYVFQSELNQQTLRMTIGSPLVWSIPEAQQRARELQRQIDEGRDPREVKAALKAAAEARKEETKRRALTVGEVWPKYMAVGKPRRKDTWKPRYVADLMKAAAPGGEPKKRGKGVTKPGHLAPLMALPLAEINQDAIRDWYAIQKKSAPVQASRAMAMFSGFLSWCATRKEYRALVDKTAARASEMGDVLPKANKRTDALEIDQLPAWFAATDKLRSRTAAAYLQALVLTGARREEMAGLRWDAIDFRWNKLTLADKVDATRTIPLTPYMAWLLRSLPRVKDNPYVFASPTSKSGRIAEPRAPHADVLADAGIDHISIHGLRRSFALLGEAAGAPAGAIAQVMGHKPSAVHEGYKPRSIDALRPYLAQVEHFILEQAGVPAVADEEPTKLRAVK